MQEANYNTNISKIINKIEEEIDYYLRVCLLSKDNILKTNESLIDFIKKFKSKIQENQNTVINQNENEIYEKIKSIEYFGKYLNNEITSNTNKNIYTQFLNDITFLKEKSQLLESKSRDILQKINENFIKNIKYQIDLFINIKILHEYIRIFKNFPNTNRPIKNYIYHLDYIKFLYVNQLESINKNDKNQGILTFNDIETRYLTLLNGMDTVIDSKKLTDMKYIVEIMDSNFDKYTSLSQLFEKFIEKLSINEYKLSNNEIIIDNLNNIISKVKKEYIPDIEKLIQQKGEYEKEIEIKEESEIKQSIFKNIEMYSNILIKIIEYYFSKDKNFNAFIYDKILINKNNDNNRIDIINNIKNKNKEFIKDLNKQNNLNINDFFIKCNNYLLVILEIVTAFYTFKYEKLEQNYNILADNCSKTNEENDNLKKELQNLSKLTINLESLTKLNKQLEQEKNELIYIKDSLSQKLNEANIKLNDTQLLDKKINEIKNLENEIQQISNENKEIIKLIKKTLYEKFSLIFKNSIPEFNDSDDINDYIIKIYEIINKEFERLNSQIKDNDKFYKNELFKLNEYITKLKENNDILKLDKNKQSQEINKLKEQINMKNEENQKIINDNLKSLKNELDNRKKEYESNLDKLKNNEWTIGTALQEKDKALKELNNLKEVNNKLLIRIKELEDNIQKQLVSITQNLQIIQDLKTENENIKNINLNNDELNKTIDKLINENKLYKDQINQLNELQLMNNKDLELKYNTLKAKLNKEIEDLNKQLTNYIEELKLCQANSNEINTKKLELEQLKIKLWQTNDDLRKELKECNEKNNKLEVEKQSILKKIYELENINVDLDNDKDLLNIEINQLKQKNIELENKLSSNSNEENSLINDLNKQTEKLSNELSSLNITNENNVNKLKEIIKNNLNTVINLNIKNNKLQLQIKNLLEENKNLLANKNILESEIISNKEFHNNLLKELTQKYDNNVKELEQIKEILNNKQLQIQEYIQKNKISEDEIIQLKKKILN